MRQVGIPGGRGVRHGVDANVAYRESIDERAKRLPPIGTLAVSCSSEGFGSVSCVADRLILAPVKTTERASILYEVRTAVDIAVAGAFLRAALYVYRGRVDGFVRVPFSDVSLSCASIGRTGQLLYDDVSAEVGARYFVGTCVSSAAVSLMGFVSPNGSALAPVYVEHSSATDLPVIVRTEDVAHGSTLAFPLVSYISHEATGVM